MFYIIYQITNVLNNKIYIGKHQTKDLNDGYMGSGKRLKHAISKHGIENFKKEILFQFDDEAEMNAKEVELVTQEFCLREDTYNLCPGGHGGWGYVNQNDLTPRMLGKTQSEKQKQVSSSLISERNKTGKTSESMKNYYAKNDHPWLGRKHSEETKKKMSKPKNEGSLNSQFGTMWITNGQENKKIKKIDTIPEGWYKGRK